MLYIHYLASQIVPLLADERIAGDAAVARIDRDCVRLINSTEFVKSEYTFGVGRPRSLILAHSLRTEAINEAAGLAPAALAP